MKGNQLRDSCQLKKQLQQYTAKIPFISRFSLKVQSVERGFICLLLEPHQALFNHFGTYQAGVYYTLAEITGGLACGTFFAVSENLLITKHSNISFLAASSSPLHSIARIKEDEIKRVLFELNLKKKAEILVRVELKDEDEKIIVRCSTSAIIGHKGVKMSL